MRQIGSSMLVTGASHFRAKHLMFGAIGAVLCASAIANGTALAQATGPSAQVTEEVIIRAPDVVRRQLPRSGPGTPPGLTNPEIVSLTRAVSYSDLDLSKASDVTELETRVKNTARDVCQELNRRFPKANNQYVYANTDCVKKATDDGMEVVRQITAAQR